MFATMIFAQEKPLFECSPKSERFRQMEKLKLIEILNMDEETSIRFFARRNKNTEEIRKLVEQRDKLLQKLADNLTNDADHYKSLTDKILQLEKAIFDKRAAFVNSLNDILNEEQIAKLIVFENRFKKELREYFFHGGKRMRHRGN